MSKSTTFLLIVLLFSASPAIAKGLTDEERADLAWFRGLGFPDVSKAPYVRVQTGSWAHRGGRPGEPIRVHAFLLGEDGDRFTVLGRNLEVKTYQRKPDGTPELERVEFERLDFAAEMRARFQKEGEARTIAILLASAAEGRGDEEAAHILFERARKAREWRKGSESWSLRKRLEEDFSELWIWQAISAFGNLEISRPEILVTCEQVLTHVPDTVHAERAKYTADLLRKMIAEDQAHAKTAKPLAELTGDDRIRELVFRLRDQNGHQMSQPGSCDVFNDPRREGSPAHQLVAAGKAAVPFLREAIEDESFSRSVGYWRNFTFSHRVLRVGDCARAVLGRISAREGGTEQDLARDVAAGDRSSIDKARNLRKRFPASALAAIAAGVRAAKEDWVRERLVFEAGWIEGEAVVTFLLGVQESAPDLMSRVAAATALNRKGRAEAVAAMIAEWRALPVRKGRIARGVNDLIEFLAKSGSVLAVRALAQDAETLPVVYRYEVVTAFNTTKPAPPVVDAAITELLFAALADERPRMGISGSMAGHSFSDPRICDVAGIVLTIRNPEKYPFESRAARATRDRAIRALRNERRKAKGLPLLPEPEIRGIVPVPKADVLALVRAAIKAAPGPERAKCTGEIREKGLGALPALVGALDGVEDAAAKEALAETAGRMASIVRETRTGKDSLLLPGPLGGMLKALEGKVLTVDRVRTLLLQYLKDPPPGTVELQVTIVKPDDFTGVTVELILRRAAVERPSSPKKVGHRESVSIDGRTLHSTSGVAFWSWIRDRNGFKHLGEALEKALAASPETGFELLVGLYRARD